MKLVGRTRREERRVCLRAGAAEAAWLSFGWRRKGDSATFFSANVDAGLVLTHHRYRVSSTPAVTQSPADPVTLPEDLARQNDCCARLHPPALLAGDDTQSSEAREVRTGKSEPERREVSQYGCWSTESSRAARGRESGGFEP